MAGCEGVEAGWGWDRGALDAAGWGVSVTRAGCAETVAVAGVLAVGGVARRAGDRRAMRPSRRAAVSAISQTQAAASGGSESPDISASTSWLPFSDQFHRK